MIGPVSEAVVTDVAPGVRQVTVTSVVTMHVYLLDTPEGVVAVDAAIRGAGPDILAAAGGRVAKVILTHAHVDHRGAASELGAPIHCHPDEVADAEGDAGRHYGDLSLVDNPALREGLPQLHDMWDGGPVTIAGTIEEGEEVAGFRVVHVPGHAPGQIVLFREEDRLLLGADVVFTVGDMGEPVPARLPPPAFNWDTEQARASIEKVRQLGASNVWLGHGEHVSGDVDAQLRAAAAS